MLGETIVVGLALFFIGTAVGILLMHRRPKAKVLWLTKPEEDRRVWDIDASHPASVTLTAEDWQALKDAAVITAELQLQVGEDG